MRCKINIFIPLFCLIFGLSTLQAKILCENHTQELKVGAQKMEELLPKLKNKRVGLVINQTSMVDHTLLIDTLKQLGVNITAAFAPEHGVRGEADAGAKVGNEKDAKTGVLIYSIYRKIRYKEMINFSKILKFPIFGISNLIVVCIGSLF